MKALLAKVQQLLGRQNNDDIDFDTWGEQTCGLDFEQIRQVMEWLALSLYQAGYRGKAQVIWYADDQPDESYAQGLKRSLKSGKPTFLYRCGDTKLPLPAGYYWRLVQEHPTLRIHQLEVKSTD